MGLRKFKQYELTWKNYDYNRRIEYSELADLIESNYEILVETCDEKQVKQ